MRTEKPSPEWLPPVCCKRGTRSYKCGTCQIHADGQNVKTIIWGCSTHMGTAKSIWCFNQTLLSSLTCQVFCFFFWFCWVCKGSIIQRMTSEFPVCRLLLYDVSSWSRSSHVELFGASETIAVCDRPSVAAVEQLWKVRTASHPETSSPWRSASSSLQAAFLPEAGIRSGKQLYILHFVSSFMYVSMYVCM